MLHPFIISLWTLLQILIGYNLILPLLLFFFYKIKGAFLKTIEPVSAKSDYDYGIIVTAYEQTDLLPSVVDSILKLNYKNFLVYIVADNCDVSNLNFNNDKINILRPDEVLASNTASHFYAISHFKRKHEIITIIDSDNLVKADYLQELNKWFEKGFDAVQGLRRAKNLNSTIAALDAARDMYYHFYDGEILFKLGSSATLSGSGMAFKTDLYIESLKNSPIKGAGFDKFLQYAIINKGYRIAFAKDAIVFDEKTSGSEQLIKQRSRWIYAWFKYFLNGFSLLKKGILNLNLNQFLFSLIILRPPLFIFLLLSVLCTIVNVFINPQIAIIWILALICFITGFSISIIQKNTDRRIYRALSGIPMFIFYQILSLFKVRSANKISVATRHVHKKNVEEI